MWSFSDYRDGRWKYMYKKKDYSILSSYGYSLVPYGYSLVPLPLLPCNPEYYFHCDEVILASMEESVPTTCYGWLFWQKAFNNNYFCYCRFSPFVKTGTESFVLGAAATKSTIPDTEKVTIILSPEGTHFVVCTCIDHTWKFLLVAR